jgi:hypothetical protein
MEIHGKVAIAYKEYERLLKADADLKKILTGAPLSVAKEAAKEESSAEKLAGEGIAAFVLPFEPPEPVGLPLASRPSYVVKEDPIMPVDVSNAIKRLPEPTYDPIVTAEAVNEVPASTANVTKKKQKFWWHQGPLDPI